MIALLRSTPAPQGTDVAQIMLGGLKWTLAGSLVVFIAIAVLMAVPFDNSTLFHMIENAAYMMIGALIYWLISVPIVAVALAITRPIARRAIYTGWAGLVVAMLVGAAAVGVALVLLAFASLLPVGGIFNAMSVSSVIGCSYGALFWAGCWRVAPAIFMAQG